MIKKFNKFIAIIVLLFSAPVLFIVPGCSDKENTLPLAPINITIDPNSTIYQELNVVGGWLYLAEEDGVISPSRGIIVHRLTTDQFASFERTPPYKPDSCCNPAGSICSKLVVEEYPFIIDPCTGSKYLIIDGSVVQSPSNMPLGTYVSEYDGHLLYIHN